MKRKKQILWVLLLVISIVFTQMVYTGTALAAVDENAPARPTVNKVEDNSTIVTGKAEPWSIVTIKVKKNELGHATADNTGAFSIAITKQTAGTVLKITATNAAGHTSKARKVTVSASAGTPITTPVGVKSVSIDNANAALNPLAIKQILKLTATVAPSNATNKNVTWSSSNPAVASVSTDGLVTAVGAGTATISVKTQDGGITANCIVTVTASTTVSKPAAKLIFTFDDGWKDTLTVAAPILAKAGFKGTVYVCKESSTEQWGWDQGIMNVSELNKLYKDYGWDISNHTSDHYDRFTKTNQTVEQQIKQYLGPLVQDYRDNQEWLLQNGWTRGAYFAAYPSGYYSTELIDSLKGIGVKTARTVNDGLVTLPITDSKYGYYLLPVQYVEDGNAASVKAYIDSAVSQEKTGILMIHKVENTTGDLVTTTSDLQQIVDYALKYVNSSQLEVLSMSEWYK